MISKFSLAGAISLMVTILLATLPLYSDEGSLESSLKSEIAKVQALALKFGGDYPPDIFFEDGSPLESKLEILSNFWKAISETKHPDFSKTYAISFSKNNTFSTQRLGQSIILRIDDNFKEWIRVLSSNPLDEISFREYKKNATPTNLKKVAPYLGSWLPIHEVAEKLLCNYGDLGKINDEDLQRIGSSLIKNSTIRRSFQKNEPYPGQLIELFFKDTIVRMNVEEMKNDKFLDLFNPFFSANVTIEKIDVFGHKKQIEVAIYNSPCKLSSSEIAGSEDKDGYITSRKSIDYLGNLKSVSTGLNPEIIPVKSLASRPIVAIFDEGVDYNHRDIIGNIPRIDPIKNAANLEKIQNLRAKLDSTIEPGNHYLLFSFSEILTEKAQGLLKSIIKLQYENSIGWDFIENDDRPYPDLAERGSQGNLNHGTLVAGLASRDQVPILPIRYSMRFEREAIDYAHFKGAKVVNISAGNSQKDLWAGIDEGIKKYPDLLFVIAAGNHGTDNDVVPDYPSNFSAPNVLVVASVDDKNILAKSSNYGVKSVGIAALGVRVKSTILNDKYDLASGTSFAAPIVANIAGKMFMKRPSLTPEQVIAIIEKTAIRTTEMIKKVKSGGSIDEQACIAEISK